MMSVYNLKPLTDIISLDKKLGMRRKSWLIIMDSVTVVFY
ncbi:hypothetical protein NBRC111893_2 [Lentilactobacillus kosonis]|uniref:Uncharacterized protein n=1 Tax=Lentilactobacillus kosonis TaxID=2810561 RepID=A0A401FHU4_9LACO|nr:hypothetical protein NBRC111893_2 [Lentilactobacillus kosonis]